MSHCPSCGRYVGPYESCPHCGARLSGRIPIRVVKLFAVTVATVGLVVLWFVATRAQVPLIQVGQAGAMMNMAYVRLAGRCTSAPTYDSESEYLSFVIEDVTGEIRVFSYRAETRQIIAQGRLPAVGDLIEVAGTLRVRDDSAALVIESPGQLKTTRADPADRDIATIGSGDVYLRVRVRGQVRDIQEPYLGLTLLTIRDRTGAIPVAVTDDLVALSGNPIDVRKGQAVEVLAAVSLYRGRPQLVPASVTDIVPLSQPISIAIERSTGELMAADVGRLVTVRGNVARVDALSSGARVTVDDGSGAVAVILWQSVQGEPVGASSLEMGAEVQVTGEVALYQGELELVPALPQDVRVLAAAPPSPDPTAPARPTPTLTHQPSPSPSRAAEATPTTTSQEAPAPRDTSTPERSPTPGVALMVMGAITPGHVGEYVTVEGTVVNAASFPNGFRFTLDDGTGQIALVMWHEVYDDCWDAGKINLGATVRAKGRVVLYEGEWQIQPNAGGDVKAVRSAAAWAPLRGIGFLSGDEAGERVMIEGQVIRVEGLQSAVKVFLGDESGEVLVFIWRDILDRIVENRALGTVGSRVRVVGTVEVYRANLEVTPALPGDVTVLEMP